MNGFYKQTLFYSGKEMRAETIANYNALIPAYGIFLSKYSQYQPFSFRHDANFVPDIMRGQKIVLSIGEKVQSGNLKEVHIQLEGIRPIFQDILKRNGFSMLAVTLVDFHDSMEKVIAAADLKDAK